MFSKCLVWKCPISPTKLKFMLQSSQKLKTFNKNVWRIFFVNNLIRFLAWLESEIYVFNYSDIKLTYVVVKWQLLKRGGLIVVTPIVKKRRILNKCLQVFNICYLLWHIIIPALKSSVLAKKLLTLRIGKKIFF